MKKGRKILIAILTMLCVVAAVLGIVGCKGSCNDNKSGETKYDAIYNAYAEVLGKEAMGHDEWYVVYMDSIDAAELGKAYIVESAEVVTDDADYVEFVISGKIYRLSLEGSDFTECVVFNLSVKDEDDVALGNTYLDIYYESEGEKVVWRTIRTDATTGTFALYVPAKETKTFGIAVSTRNNTNHTFGIPAGEEPTFTPSSPKDIEVVLYDATTYIIRVNNVLNRQMADVAVGIFYNDADNKSEIAGGVTDATGTLTLYFVKQDTHSYVVKFRDVPNAIPEYFYSDQESWDLSFESNGIGLTLITLSKGVEYHDYDLGVSGNPGKQLNVNAKYEPVPVDLTRGITVEDLEKDQNGNYSWNGSPLYVALGKSIARSAEKWTILKLLEEDNKYFLGVELHYDDETNPEHDEGIAILENVWDRYNYYKMLTTYGELANSDGLYALNNDLLRFVTTNAKLFPGAEEGSEDNWLLPVMYYDGPKLGIGAEAKYENYRLTPYSQDQDSMPVRSDIPAGFYSLSVDIGGKTAPSGETYSVVVNGYNFMVKTTTTRDPYGNTITTRAAIIYLNEGTTSILVAHQTVSSYTITCELKSLGATYVPERVDTNGEYVMPLFPSSFLPGSYSDALPIFTKLYQRKYYNYTTEILELPEGVNSITGVFSIYNANNAGTLQKQVLQAGSSLELNCYEKNMDETRVPKMFFMYDDKGTGEILFVKIKMTFVNNKVNVTYSGGEGATGSVAMHEAMDIGASITLNANGFTKAGYTFVGWTLDGVTIYKPGAIYVIASSEDVEFKAVWREGSSDVAEDTLGVGEDNKLNLTIDADTFTGIEISFTSGITATRYFLTVDFGERNLGKQLNLTLLNNSGNVTKTSFLMYSAAKSEEGHNVYIVYFNKAAADVKFAISLAECSGTIQAEFLLTAYDFDVELTVGETVEAPLSLYSETYSTGFRVKYGEDITASTYYRMYITNTTEITMTIQAYRQSTSYSPTLTLKPGETGVVTVQSYSTLTNPNYYFWLKGYSGKSSTTYYATVNVRLEIANTVTYQKGTTDTTTGNLPSTERYAKGESVTITSNTLTRVDYEFMGWTTDGESEYDATKTYLHAGDKYEMGEEAVVFTAVWRALVYGRASLGIGDGAKASLTIDPEMYDSYQLDFLREVSAGNYKLTAEFNSYMGECILLTIGSSSTAYLVTNSALTSEGKYVYIAVMAITDNDIYIHFSVDTVTSAQATFKLESYEQATIEANGNFIDVVFNPYNTSNKIVIPVGDSIDARYYKLYFKTELIEGSVFPSMDFWYSSSSSYRITSITDNVFSVGYNINVPAGVTEFYLIGYSSSYNYYMAAFSIKLEKLYSATYTGGEGATGTAPLSQIHMLPGDVFAVAYNSFTKTNCDFLGWKNLADAEDTKLYQPGEIITVTDKDYKFEAQWTVDPNAGEGGDPSEPTVNVVEDKLTASSGLTVDLNPEYDLITVELDDSVTVPLGYKVEADFGAKNIGNEFIVTVGDATLYLARGLGANPTDDTNIYVGWVYITAARKSLTFSTSYVDESTQFTLAITSLTKANATFVGTAELNKAYIDIPVGAYGEGAATTAFRFGVTTRFSTYYLQIVNLTSVGSMDIYVKGGTASYPDTKGSTTTTLNAGITEYALSTIYSRIGDSNASRLSFYGNNSSIQKTYFTVSVKLYSNVTLSYNKNAEDATGNVSSQTVPGGSNATLAECGFVRPGYSFIGWATVATPGDEDTIYQPGEQILVDANKTMYAQWRADDVSESEQQLGLGADGKVSDIAVNLNTADAVAIPFSAPSGAYVITAVLDTNLGNTFYVSVGMKKVKNVMLEIDEDASTTGRFVYVGYLSKQEDDEALQIPQSLNGKIEVTIIEMSLSEYTTPTIKADGEFVKVVLNSSDISDTSESRFMVNLDPSDIYDADHHYIIYLKKGDNYDVAPSVGVYLGGFNNGFRWPTVYGDPYVDGYRDCSYSGNSLTMMLYSSTNGSPSGTYYVALKALYNVTYVPGVAADDDVPVTGSTIYPQNYLDPNEVIFLRDNYAFERNSYAFIGWTLDGGETVYQPGDKYTVNGDAVFSAVWTSTSETFSGTTLGLGEENKVTGIKLNPTENTDVTIDLVEFAKAYNYYYLTLDISEDYGDNFLITLNYATRIFLNHKAELDTEGHYIYGGFIPTILSHTPGNNSLIPDVVATTLQLTTYDKSRPAATVYEIKLEEKVQQLSNMNHDTVEIFVPTRTMVNSMTTSYTISHKINLNTRTFLSGDYNIWLSTKAPVAGCSGSFMSFHYDNSSYNGYNERKINMEEPMVSQISGTVSCVSDSYVGYGFTIVLTVEHL
ncbi:MAG: InlB B-repeat-containing protein [Clostridiales bacterium]|nr:InlB B-repeat-containing protein [Clostridiales bacterium]